LARFLRFFLHFWECLFTSMLPITTVLSGMTSQPDNAARAVKSERRCKLALQMVE